MIDRALSGLLPVRCRRGQLLVILAPPRSGASTILKRFAGRHPRLQGLGKVADKLSIIYLDAPPSTGAMRIAKSVLSVFNREAALGSKAELFARLPAYLMACGTRILIIDHAHWLANGRGIDVRQSLTLLCDLQTKTGVNIVMVGSGAIMEIVEGFRNLGKEVKTLELQAFRNDKEYHIFLRQFSKQIPLDCSSLTTEPLRSSLLRMSGGFPGRLVDTIRSAAKQALEEGSTALDSNHFESTTVL